MPMIESPPDAIARIYARALYDLAEQAGGRGKVEEILGELEDIMDMARGNAQFGELLASRSINSKARGESISRVFKGRVTDLTLNFLMVLNGKGRVAALGGIVAAFDSIVQERFGRIEIDAFTAEPLDANGVADLRGRLARSLNKDVVLHAYVEPSMIGGVKFRIGDQLIDASVATQLRRLKDSVENEGGARLRARIDSLLGSD